jgi:hypothetical protein
MRVSFTDDAEEHLKATLKLVSSGSFEVDYDSGHQLGDFLGVGGVAELVVGLL